MTEMETVTEDSSSGDFLKAYARLRTVLDGMEITSLRYCLKDKDEAKRIARAEELEQALMPIIVKYQTSMGSGPGAGCPDGYFDCNGCCVPYPCP
ncbi:MAG: hypothetical protein M3Q78_05070 [Acidobacteriota bacterium]|nr:hypothetical protein [Acidobacteriota bacterium]